MMILKLNDYCDKFWWYYSIIAATSRYRAKKMKEQQTQDKSINYQPSTCDKTINFDKKKCNICQIKKQQQKTLQKIPNLDSFNFD